MTGRNGSGSELVQDEITFEERKGAIVMFFGSRYAILLPEQAMGMGEVLMRYGHHAMTGVDHPGTKTLSAQIVRKLENTVAAALAEMDGQNKTPMYKAERVVDICMTEVT